MRTASLHVACLPKRRSVLSLVVPGVLLCVLLVWGVHTGLDMLRDGNRRTAQRTQSVHLADKIQHAVFERLHGVTHELALADPIVAAATGRAEPDSPSVLLVLNSARSVFGASLVYVMDARGTVVACTPYDDGQTLTGNNYAFRPYFTSAMDGGDTVYPGLGVTTGIRGLYVSSPVRVSLSGDPVGAVVIKARFDSIDALFEACEEPAALMSPDGIILATNRPDWMFRAALPIGDDRRAALLKSRQFADRPLDPLTPCLDRPTVTLGGESYTTDRCDVAGTGWQILTLARSDTVVPLTGSQQRVFGLAMLAVVLLLITSILLGANVMRRRRAERALRSMNEYLETRVAERTAELERANEGLRTEVIERRRVEEMLRESERRLADIFNFLPDATFAIDATGHVSAWNRAMEEMSGIRAEDIVGEGDHAYAMPFYGERRPILIDYALHPDDDLASRYPAIKRDGDVFIAEVQVVSPDGGPRVLWGAAKPLHDPDGKVVGAIESVRDITEIRYAESKLRESEERYRAIFESFQDVYYRTNAEGRITEISPSIQAAAGYTPEEVIGRSAVDVYRDPSDRAALMRELTKHGMVTDYELQLLAKDGRVLDVSLNARLLRGGDVSTSGVEGVLRDITDRKRAEKELRHSNARMVEALRRERRVAMELEAAMQQLEAATREAQAATRAKSEFLANMSHEIRTPMTAITGFAEALRDELRKCAACQSHAPFGGRPRHDDYLDTICRNGSYLISIINDILDLSKIEVGKLDIERDRFSPTQLVRDVQSLMLVRAEAKGLALHVEADGRVPETIWSDPTRLKQILVNVIGNAIKFTESGSVRLVVRGVEPGDERSGDGCGSLLRFDVADTGIGMTRDSLARIFEPFSQADSSSTRRHGGTGLGLTISKRLAVMLGGDITVQSEPGHGSTFHITVATGPLDAVRLLDALPEFAPGPPSPDDKTEEQALGGRRLLFAEDGLDNQRLIRLVLERAGAHVTVVENGRQAVEAAVGAMRGRRANDAGSPFDAVLMDMQMPVMDGYEATRALRRLGYCNPVIALTAHAMSTDREKCLAAGCDDYVTKPIDREHLVAVIRFWVASPASLAQFASGRAQPPGRGWLPITGPT